MSKVYIFEQQRCGYVRGVTTYEVKATSEEEAIARMNDYDYDNEDFEVHRDDTDGVDSPELIDVKE